MFNSVTTAFNQASTIARRGTGGCVGFLLVFIVAVTMSLLTAFLFPDESPPPPFTDSSNVLIRIVPGISPEKVVAALGLPDDSVIWRQPTLDLFAIRTPPDVGLSKLKSAPGVRFAEPEFLAQLSDGEKTDPRLPQQSPQIALGLPDAWKITEGDPAIRIALIDTGVDLMHPDLFPNLAPGWDAIQQTDQPMDVHGHGTKLAGIIAAVRNNGIDITGVAPKCKLVPVRVASRQGWATYRHLIDGIVWAADQGIPILCIALGGSRPSKALEEAIRYAQEKGCFIVAAAGNGGANDAFYPAAYKNVFSVTGVDERYQPMPDINTGPGMDIAAPAQASATTGLLEAEVTVGGSSAATAYVAGVAALCLSRAPDLTPRQLASVL